jgi:hypothetical protein
MMTDLGTYHVRVELVDGRGWIEKWSTGLRFTGGTDCWSPLNAQLILGTWENEADLFNTIVYEYTEGNSSCDCNKSLALINAYQQFDAQESECGNTMQLRRLTVIRPDASEIVVLSYPQKREW